MEYCYKTLSPNNPEGIFREGSLIRRIMFIIFGVVFWSVITVLIYFSLVGIGLLTSLTVWHDYDIYTGCLKNETCKRPQLLCSIDQNYKIYMACALPGILSTLILLSGLVGFIYLCIGGYEGLSLIHI